MNIVDLVTSRLTGDVLGKIGGLVGLDESRTRSASNAAVPALLDVLAKLASTGTGAGQLATALGGLDLKTIGDLAGLLGGGRAPSLGSLGGSLLTSLLGKNMGGIVNALSTFLDVQPGVGKTLLTYLAPVVLGTVAEQFQGGTANASGLQRLFAEQRDNITAALPGGLSLPALDLSTAAHQTQERAAMLPSWLPWLLLPFMALLGWSLWPKQPPKPRAVVIEEVRRTEGPVTVEQTAVIEQEGKKVVAVVEETVEMAPGVAEALKLGEDLTGVVGTLAKVLAGVQDEVTARDAMPRIEECGPAIEALRKSTAALPPAGRTTMVDLVAKNIGGLQRAFDAVMAIPGVKEIIGPVVAPMLETLAKRGS